jgi:hypothetical protein
METDGLFKQYAFQRWYMGLLVDDIPDERMTAQPGPLITHPAWQLGHLADVADNALHIAGGKRTLDADWATRYAQNSIPTANRADYPSKSELLQIVDDRRNALLAHCAKLSDADWRKPQPIGLLAEMLPSIWHCMHFLMLTHESAHLGGIAAWRRCMGMPMALSRARG